MKTSFLRDVGRGVAALALGSALFLSVGCGNSGATQSGGNTTATPSGSTVATVNGEKIEQKELDQELNRMHGREVLQALIDDRLITQAAVKEKIQIDEKELQTQLTDLKKTPQYAAMLKAKNMTDADVEKYMRRLMEMKKLILMEIPPSETMKMYDQYKEQLEQAHIYDILVDKKEDADKIVAQLKAGGNFEQIAKENSKDESSKDRGGDLGWVPHSAPLDPAFAKIAFTIPVDQIAGPVETKSGWAILKVTGRKKSFDDLKNDIEDRLVAVRQGEFMQRLRVKADIKTKFDGAGGGPSGAPAGKSLPGAPASPLALPSDMPSPAAESK